MSNDEIVSWKASSGRIERIAIFYGGLLLGGFFYIRVMIFIGIIVIPITLKRLLSSKLVCELTFDDEKQTLKIRFSGSMEMLQYENLAFAYNSENNSYNELTLYKTFVGTRGQLVKTHLTDIIGLKWTTSWKKSQVEEIVHSLTVRNIVSYLPANKDLPLWERYI